MDIGWFFNDKNGHLVVWQKPNLPLWTWLVATVLVKLTRYPNQQLFKVIAFGALFTWAWQELFDGASMFRRVLGGVVLLLTIWSHLVPSLA